MFLNNTVFMSNIKIYVSSTPSEIFFGKPLNFKIKIFILAPLIWCAQTIFVKGVVAQQKNEEQLFSWKSFQS